VARAVGRNILTRSAIEWHRWISGRALTDEPSLPRFMIRQGNRGLMVWDRQRKGPAMYNGHLAIGLTELQANEIKVQLSRYYAE